MEKVFAGIGEHETAGIQSALLSTQEKNTAATNDIDHEKFIPRSASAYAPRFSRAYTDGRKSSIPDGRISKTAKLIQSEDEEETENVFKIF